MKSRIIIYICLLLIGCGSHKDHALLYQEMMAEAPMDELIREGRQLRFAYKHKDTTFLTPFFVHWQNDSQPISNSEFEKLSDVEKAVYEIFQEFYKQGQNLHQSEYLVVQNEINYKIVSDSVDLDTIDAFYAGDLEYILSGSISDFKPNIQVSNKKIVFLFNNYLKALESLFEQGRGGWSKRAFLLPKIRVEPGHWGGYYHYVTFPEVHVIVFNESLSEARINYRATWHTGYYTIYEKGDSGWTRVEDVFNWIE